jgi:hypothetical protein
MKKGELIAFHDYLRQLDVPQVSISEQFVYWLRKRDSISELQALEFYEENSERVLKIIQSEIDFHKAKYTFSKFQFASYDKDILIQTSFITDQRPKEEVLIKIEWWQKIDQLIRKLNWRDFELLATEILRVNGLTEIRITQSKNDQGIDFYGYYNFNSKRHLNRLENDIRFRVVGQVKHSANRNGVSHQKIASFGTELTKLRKLNSNNYFVNLDEAFLLCPYPIIGIFIANSYYPNKAEDFGKEYGMILWEGVQISQDLATSLFISKVRDDAGELSKDKLIEIIKNH